MPDANGNPYVHPNQATVGAHVTVDPTVHLQLANSGTLTIFMDTATLAPHLCVPGLYGSGNYSLAGQLNSDGVVHGGVSPDGTEFLGFYHHS